MQTVLKKCDCQHEWQDKTYGKGLRVHNETVTKNGPPQFRCTVCGKEKG